MSEFFYPTCEPILHHLLRYVGSRSSTLQLCPPCLASVTILVREQSTLNLNYSLKLPTISFKKPRILIVCIFYPLGANRSQSMESHVEGNIAGPPWGNGPYIEFMSRRLHLYEWVGWVGGGVGWPWSVNNLYGI